MSANLGSASGASDTTPTYPHIGTVLVGVGIGLATFSASSDGVVPEPVKATLAGMGAAASAVGLFLLGRSTA